MLRLVDQPRTRIPFALFALAALFATPALAQQAATTVPASPAKAIDALCAAAPSADELLDTFLEKILAPGKPFSLEGIPPAMLVKMGAFQAAAAKQQVHDWPNLCKYRAENAAVLKRGVRPQVIFLGDSITEFWKLADPGLFSDTVLDRGISGQTTPQILLRFYPDVIALHPRVVHILAGTNDIAASTGPETDDTIVANIRAMLDLARATGIKVVLASITPTSAANRERPGARIAALNVRLRALAAERGAVFVDYYAKLTKESGILDPALANDGLHPNRAGYAVMRPLTDAALARARR